MKLSRIRLELARDKDFPEGSSKHGYDFAAPLDEQGHIDADAWQSVKDQCRVVRFWEGEDNEVGHLVHKGGRGAGGSWAFHYDIKGQAEQDETGYRLADHLFKPGSYVSINEQDGVLRTFRVVSVLDLDRT